MYKELQELLEGIESDKVTFEEAKERLEWLTLCELVEDFKDMDELKEDLKNHIETERHELYVASLEACKSIIANKNNKDYNSQDDEKAIANYLDTFTHTQLVMSTYQYDNDWEAQQYVGDTKEEFDEYEAWDKATIIKDRIGWGLCEYYSAPLVEYEHFVFDIIKKMKRGVWIWLKD